ncbi:MAG: NAD-dependent epimerase/dehydratase family protein [Planctomycetota bacterium]|jgi:nucleoside-diphosphate-sugar epimerase
MKALVTGGGGFLGGAIVRQLIERGDKVITFQRGDYPELAELGAAVVRGDLTDTEAIAAAAEGVDAVFHVAARAGVWGSYDSYYRANVVGTRNVVAACVRHDVPRLVFTSSPSVTFGGRDEDGVDESHPYPDRYLTAYPKTKALAEQHVLEMNGPGLATVALRPHLIWGPGDPHLVPRIVERARAGRLRLIGDGQNKVDSTYVDNAAHAHLAAYDALTDHNAAPAGKAYYISNGQPLPMADLLNRILDAAGEPPVTRRVSPRAAYVVGALLETIHGLLRLKAEPIMTRFVARQLATAHWFDLSAARRDFHYDPPVTQDEAFTRLAASLRGASS